MIETVENAGSSTSLSLTSNYVLNFLLAGSLNQLWALIRSQQILVLLPLYKITLPANAGNFYNVLMQIAAFEVMEMNERYVRATGQSTNALSDNFSIIGFDSMWFVNNMSTLGITLFFIPLVYLLRPLLYPFKKQINIYRFRKKLKKSLYWGLPIRVQQESYLIIVICSMINLRWLHVETVWSAVNLTASALFLLIAFSIPVLIGFLLHNYKK